MSGPGDPLPSGYGGGAERRSVRYGRERRPRPERPLRVIVAAFLTVVVVTAVAVLSSPLVSSGRTVTVSTDVAAGVTTGPMPTTGASGSVPGSDPGSGPGEQPRGSSLLVIQQDGKPALLVLLCAGPDGGAVLGLPAATLLRSGDRFVVLADAYSPADPDNVARLVSGAFRVPLSAMASVEWSALRSVLASGPLAEALPESLDPLGSGAGSVVGSLGPLAKKEPAAGWLQGHTSAGQGEAFSAALAAGIQTAGDKAWTGMALEGLAVEYADGSWYLEPHIRHALDLLAETGVTGGSAGEE